MYLAAVEVLDGLFFLRPILPLIFLYLPPLSPLAIQPSSAYCTHYLAPFSFQLAARPSPTLPPTAPIHNFHSPMCHALLLVISPLSTLAQHLLIYLAHHLLQTWFLRKTSASLLTLWSRRELLRRFRRCPSFPIASRLGMR